MSDEVIKMCNEIRRGYGYCVHQLNHKGPHEFPSEHSHGYTKSQADALIAGAYLACARRAKAEGQEWVRVHQQERNLAAKEACENIEHGILCLLPDAARLALEERIANASKPQHHLACNFWNQPIGGPGCMCVFTYAKEIAEREAKLIADTRLNEAEWWADGHHDGSRSSPKWIGRPCPQCDRLAAHRAAVQEKPQQ